MERINERFAARRGAATAPRRPQSAMRVLRERLPSRVQHAIGRAVPLSWKDAVVNRAITGGHDWARTPGLAILGSVMGFVRFNLRGREKEGMLDPGSELHRSYIRCVQDAFRGWRIADTGEPLVKDMVLTSEQCAGERSDYLPDLVVSWADREPASRIRADDRGAITLRPPTGRSGNHRPDGFAIIVEPGRDRGGQAAPGDMVDLAPMVTRLLERPATALR